MSSPTTYEVGSGQPVLGVTSTGFRTYSPSISREMTNEQDIEEKYEVTVSSTYDESGLKILASNPLTISSDINQGFVFVFQFKNTKIYLFYE